MNIITSDRPCVIKPEDINTDRSLMDTIWQNMETEISAIWLVKFAQRRGHWGSFTMEELLSFYHEKRPSTESFRFNKLQPYNGPDYIVEEADRLFFTIQFVAACYAVSPA